MWGCILSKRFKFLNYYMLLVRDLLDYILKINVKLSNCLILKPRGLVWIGQRPPKPKTGGSNPPEAVFLLIP